MAVSVVSSQARILRRVRDTAGTAHIDVLLDVMSDCQRLVNACYGGVLTDDTLTLTPGQTIYAYSDFTPADVVRVLDVSLYDRPLHRTDWKMFAAHNPRWVHAQGVPRTWDTCGHTLLIVYPSPVEATTVTVRYIPELVDLTSGGNYEIPDHHVVLVEDLVCEILLLRQRLFPSIDEAASAANRHTRLRVT